nr:hypothetical protein [Bacteroidaceae bacterium]
EFGNIVAIAQDSSPTLEDLLAEAESLLFGCSYVRSSQGTKKAVLYYSIKEKEEIEGRKYSNLFIDVVELSALQDGIHEMVFIDEKYPGEPTCTDVLLIRQDGDKVYCQTENDTQEWLILDFGLKTGDIFVNGAGERFLVKEITKSEDSKRKRILLISEDGTQEDTWEEGIGSLQWGFLPNYVVKTLKYFQDVEDSMFTNLWAAANPDYFVGQGVYDEYFKLQPFDEIKDEEAEDMTLEDLPDSPLSYSFIEDSLRIQGYYPLNLYPSFAAASITGGHIDISIHQVTGLNMIKGNHIAKIDVLIPGFKAGTYKVGMSGQEYVTLECKGSSAQYNDPVTFTKDLMATIILPTVPDASKGKYYRLDRVEDGKIIFEQELQPQARVPYIIVPNEDFTIDPSTLNLEGLTQDVASIEGISFIGSYHREELPALTGGDRVESYYIDLIDTTPDCGITISAETGKETFLIGALRAYLIVSWDDPINPGGARSPKDKLEIVLKDHGTGIEEIQNSKFKMMK